MLFPVTFVRLSLCIIILKHSTILTVSLLSLSLPHTHLHRGDLEEAGRHMMQAILFSVCPLSLSLVSWLASEGMHERARPSP